MGLTCPKQEHVGEMKVQRIRSFINIQNREQVSKRTCSRCSTLDRIHLLLRHLSIIYQYSFTQRISYQIICVSHFNLSFQNHWIFLATCIFHSLVKSWLPSLLIKNNILFSKSAPPILYISIPDDIFLAKHITHAHTYFSTAVVLSFTHLPQGIIH